MSIQVGSKVTGKITGITNFGAFVQLPEGITGLVHISEVADAFVKDINEHLKKGDDVEVKVLSEKDGKVALSIKKAIDKPVEVKSAYVKRAQRHEGNYGRSSDSRAQSNFKPKENFEDKMAKFLKSSEENLSILNRSMETKRGGRGGRRG